MSLQASARVAARNTSAPARLPSMQAPAAPAGLEPARQAPDHAPTAHMGHSFGRISVHNRTGLPDELKAGIEKLSDIAIDDVKVHYNSAVPARYQARAFAQGSDIHVGPGRERHLPHEAWHVVQQKLGRVRPTVRLEQRRPARLPR